MKVAGFAPSGTSDTSTHFVPSSFAASTGAGVAVWADVHPARAAASSTPPTVSFRFMAASSRSLRLDLRPVLVHQLGGLADVFHELALGERLGRRVDSGVVPNLGRDELPGGGVRARIANAVDDARVDFRIHDVVEKRVDRVGMAPARRNADAVDPDR